MCLNKFIEDEKLKEELKGVRRDTRRRENNCLCETEGTMAGGGANEKSRQCLLSCISPSR